MFEENEKNLADLAEEFQIGKSNPDERIAKLSQIQKLYPSQNTSILNYFIKMESHPNVLFHIVKSLSKSYNEESINSFIELLLFKGIYKENNFKNTDEYMKVRCLTADILGNIKTPSAVVPLLYVLNNKEENYKLRLSSAEALGKIGDRYAVMPLIDVVSNEEEKSVYLRESAAKALGMLDDIRAIDPFLKILEAKKGIIDKFTFLKERVIESIARIGFRDDKVFKALANALLDESPCIRLSAVEALAELNDDRAVELLISLLKDEEEDVARGAVEALYYLAGRKYMETLLEMPDLPGWCRDEAEIILEEEEE